MCGFGRGGVVSWGIMWGERGGVGVEGVCLLCGHGQMHVYKVKCTHLSSYPPIRTHTHILQYTHRLAHTHIFPNTHTRTSCNTNIHIPYLHTHTQVPTHSHT